MAHLLMNKNRHTAIELQRGPKWVRLIRFGTGILHIARESVRAVDEEFVRHDEIDVRRAALMYRNSMFPKSESVEEALNAIITPKEPQMPQLDVTSATSAELVAEYNRLTKGKPITRFANRETAERRVAALLTAETIKETAVAKTKTKTKAASLSDAVKGSWANKKVATARSTKHKVKVGGEIYRSVLEAFQKLKLDVNKHIKFRALLKKQGRATFDGNVFILVEPE